MLIGQVQFCDTLCNVYKTNYAKPKDRIALQLKDAKTGEPIATATVNLPDKDVPIDYVLIKNYSENEGIYGALINAGIIEDFITQYRTGFETVLLCKLR